MSSVIIIIIMVVIRFTYFSELVVFLATSNYSKAGHVNSLLGSYKVQKYRPYAAITEQNLQLSSYKRALPYNSRPKQIMYNQTVQSVATNGFHILLLSVSSEAHVEEATAANGRTAEKQHRSQMMSIWAGCIIIILAFL
jgi:hypothetical protein